MRWTILLLFFLAASPLWGIERVQALEAFDCEDPATLIMALDTTEPAACPSPTADYEKEITETLQLIRLRKSMNVEVVQCKILMSRYVYTCAGLYSYSYGANIIDMDRVVDVSEAECRQIRKSGKISLLGKTHSVTTGERKEIRYQSEGIRKTYGGCTAAAPFQRYSQTYDSHIETTYFSVLIRDALAERMTSDKQIILPSGITAATAAGTIMDGLQGRFIWDNEQEAACDDDMSLMYSGPAQTRARRAQNDPKRVLRPPMSLNETDAVTDEKTKEVPVATQAPSTREGTIVMMGEGLKEGQHIGLSLGKAIKTCGKKCYDTASLRGFVVCFWVDGNEQFPSANFKSDDVGELDADNQHVRSDYQYLDSRLSMHETFAEVVLSLCNVERRTLYNKLQALSGVQNPHALVDLLGKGHQVTSAGSAVSYVTKCVPVEVTPTAYPNCTLEVPIKRVDSNESMMAPIQFMEPITKVLKKYPTIVICSRLMPVRWKIEDQWYCSYPELRECKAPSQLSPSTNAYHADGDFTEGLGHEGLITKVQRQRAIQFMEEASHQEAVLTQSTRHGIQNAVDGKLGEAFSFDTNFTKRLLKILHPSIIVDLLGTYTSFIIGLLAIYFMLLSCGGGVYRFTLEFVDQGWKGGRTLARAIFSCFGCLWIPFNIMRERLHEEMRDQFGLVPLPPPITASGRRKKKEARDAEAEADLVMDTLSQIVVEDQKQSAQQQSAQQQGAQKHSADRLV